MRSHSRKRHEFDRRLLRKTPILYGHGARRVYGPATAPEAGPVSPSKDLGQNDASTNASIRWSIMHMQETISGALLRTLPLGLLLVASSACAEQNNSPRPPDANRTGVTAVSNDTFLSSLGVNTHVSQGNNPGSYVLPLRYLGVRNIRDSERNLPGLILLREQSGIRVDLQGEDVSGLIVAAKTLAQAGALLAIEGPNEPNNFLITYNGQPGGGKNSWVPVAELQKDLYSAVKNDPELKQYPVFHVSEGGAETDNAGLQFLTIPRGAKTLLAEGTQFADYANPHNYVSGNNIGYVDNQAWQASDPTLDSHWDGLYGEYGRTWRRHFPGYSNAELQVLPRVTTETGWEAATVEQERTQGTVLVNTYLAQFKRGWRYTFIYQLGEGEGGGGNHGLFHENWTPKLAATYIHNLTSILADDIPVATPKKLDYSIANQPPTVHDLLLQKSDGAFQLVVWGEQVTGANNITVNLGSTQATLKIYDTTVGDAPIQTLTNVANVPLEITDHAIIVEIR
jgi:hypothetical protein